MGSTYKHRRSVHDGMLEHRHPTPGRYASWPEALGKLALLATGGLAAIAVVGLIVLLIVRGLT